MEDKQIIEIGEFRNKITNIRCVCIKLTKIGYKPKYSIDFRRQL